MTAYTVLRAIKVPANKVAGNHNHNQRTYSNQNAENIDFNWTHKNQILLGSGNTHDALKEQIKDIKRIRKDANLMVEIVFSASPEYFYDNFDKAQFDQWTMQNDLAKIAEFKSKNLNQEKLDAWIKATTDYAQKTHGANIVNMTLHLDEKTPHIHLNVCPKIDQQLSAKRYFSPQTCRKWQDDYAQTVAHLGIVRGQEDSVAVHQSHHTHAEQQELAKNTPKPPGHTTPHFFTQEEVNATKFGFAVLSKEDIYKNAVDYNKATKPKYDFYKNFYQKNKLTITEIKAVKEENQQLKKDNTMYKKKMLSDDQISKAREIQVIDICQDFSPVRESPGSSYYRIKTDNHNIVIDTKTNRFFDNNNPDCNGQGAIDFLIRVKGLDFKESVQTLASTMTDHTKIAHTILASDFNQEEKAKVIADQVKIEYQKLPESSYKNMANVTDYLKNVRKIDQQTLNDIASQLYADRRNNCVFTNKEKTTASIRGTMPGKSFKATNGLPDLITFDFNNQDNKTCYVFESPIDALSYRTLYKADGLYICTNGNTNIAKVPEVAKNFEKIVCCFDNDDQGIKFDAKIKSQCQSIQVEVHKPEEKFKDFNDQLKDPAAAAYRKIQEEFKAKIKESKPIQY